VIRPCFFSSQLCASRLERKKKREGEKGSGREILKPASLARAEAAMGLLVASQTLNLTSLGSQVQLLVQ
jgi:hypothetical protein